jgi:DNA polymerase III alpha subunit
MYTDLKDRQLWYDGDSVVPQSQLIELLHRGMSTRHLCVTEVNKDIIEYNRYATPVERVKVKTELEQLDMRWNLPEPFDTLDVDAHVEQKFFDEAARYSWDENEIMCRHERMRLELVKYREDQKVDVLRTIIYIVDTFTRENLVWGVGRGSSVSSYVLYLIGIHDIDSYKYELDFTDFLG